MKTTPKSDQKLVVKPESAGLLTRQEFQGLAQVPPEIEWFANLRNPRTRRAYQIDVRDFMAFVGIQCPQDWVVNLG